MGSYSIFSSIFLEIRIVQSQYIHSGKIAIEYKGKWEILHVEHWNNELSQLACKQMGFPGLVKILGLREYNNYNDYDNFDCQKIKDNLVCCPKKLKDRNVHQSIREVALACEQGTIMYLHSPAHLVIVVAVIFEDISVIVVSIVLSCWLVVL